MLLSAHTARVRAQRQEAAVRFELLDTGAGTQVLYSSCVICLHHRHLTTRARRPVDWERADVAPLPERTVLLIFVVPAGAVCNRFRRAAIEHKCEIARAIVLLPAQHSSLSRTGESAPRGGDLIGEIALLLRERPISKEPAQNTRISEQVW